MREPSTTPWPRRLATALFRQRWVQRWWARHYQALSAEGIPWAALSKPLPASRVALVTTGGVHLRDDPPFDMSDPDGDPSYRVIPWGSPAGALTITHDYYDHRDADRDLNVVFPLEVLGALIDEGALGAAAPRHYSLMGHIQGPHLETLRGRTAPELAGRLRGDGVDVAIFTPA